MKKCFSSTHHLSSVETNGIMWLIIICMQTTLEEGLWWVRLLLIARGTSFLPWTMSKIQTGGGLNYFSIAPFPSRLLEFGPSFLAKESQSNVGKALTRNSLSTLLTSGSLLIIIMCPLQVVSWESSFSSFRKCSDKVLIIALGTCSKQTPGRRAQASHLQATGWPI